MNSPHTGSSLIEVLISLLLLSFIMLFFDAAEVFSFKKNRDAFYFSVAVNQVYSMKERLLALKSYAGLTEQLQIWNLQNKELLPQATGTVTQKKIILNWGKHECITEEITPQV